MARAVVRHKAQLGIALDGDADRAILADERGRIVDGDAVMALVGRDLHRRGQLARGTVVATVMSNLGLERSLAEVGAKVVRTAVGDRYVVEEMRRGGFNFGGEQSGHLVFLDHVTTGDGVAAGLNVLAVMAREGRPLSELARCFEPVPQALVNVDGDGAAPARGAPGRAEGDRRGGAGAREEGQGAGALLRDREQGPGAGRGRRRAEGPRPRRGHRRRDRPGAGLALRASGAAGSALAPPLDVA